MLSRFSPHAVCLALFVALALTCAPRAAAQDTDEFGDAAADPVKLFNQGQDAHAKKEYERAVEFYEEALKLKPEFAEAEFQKGAALVALKRTAEAEKSYRRAMELKPTWALPPAALGLLLVETPGREREAEPFLRRALELDAKNLTATIALAELRSRAGDASESATFWRRATELKADDASLWVARARAELSAKDSASASKSFAQAISIEPSNVEARLGRADLALASNDKAPAVEDLRALEEQSKNDWKLAAALANRYGLAGQTEDARRVYETLPEEAKNSDAGRKLLAALSGARCEDTPESRAALEKLIASDPKNAAALSCLGTLTRTTDPQRSLELFKRALDADPRNVDYAVGYAAALNQLRRFEDAATVLQRVLQVAPDKYEAHANLAAALYELKLYKQAIVEYKWVGEARPELAVVHFFIATALDRLGEYEDALAAYETFLARADARTNELEIEKVNLRLPSLRNQIKRGEGVKKDKKAQ
ncbi:MAG: tetratricopeptide repeat protein [Acidobacteriota bacterium]|nr:tetratricopeptide repeat protein [Acidobacteriota bacterium]MDQ5838907.1 tetratricopeptide repeat protein [Acidobacteriota bacterium]